MEDLKDYVCSFSLHIHVLNFANDETYQIGDLKFSPIVSDDVTDETKLNEVPEAQIEELAMKLQNKIEWTGFFDKDFRRQRDIKYNAMQLALLPPNSYGLGIMVCNYIFELFIVLLVPNSCFKELACIISQCHLVI